MRSVPQKKNRSGFTTHKMPPSNPSSGMAVNPHLLPRLSRTHWEKPGGFPQGQRIPKKVLPMHVCLSPTSGKGCLLQQVRQRQVRADVVPQPAALPQEQPPPCPAAAAQELCVDHLPPDLS